MAILNSLISRAFQAYWRRSRGLRLAAECCVVDERDRVLLVRTPGRPDWHLPVASLADNESLEEAMRRALSMTGVASDAPAKLFWIYASAPDDPICHVALYVMRVTSEAVAQAEPGRSDTAEAFFPLGKLPAELAPALASRIEEALGGRAPRELC